MRSFYNCIVVSGLMLGMVWVGGCARGDADPNSSTGGRGGAGGGEGASGGIGGIGGQGGAGAGPMAECIGPSDAEWSMTGAEYCETLGLACAGSAYHHDGTCTDPKATIGCGSFPAFACCLNPMSGTFGNEPNTSGLWTCQSTCPPGSEKNPAGSPICMDIDECSSGTHDCGVNATCTNEPGTYKCTCDLGYTGDGKTCIAVPTEPACIKSSDQAWSLSGAQYCEQFGLACAGSAYHHDGTCTDPNATIGCGPFPAFACCQNAMAGTFGSEPNTSGFWTCQATCPAGSEMNPAGSPICIDIDECSTGMDNCDSNGTCTNKPGTFVCTCNLGFTGDGVTCVPVQPGPSCITSSDQAWSLTGDAYCALFSLSCKGAAYYNDATCSGPNPFTGCGSGNPTVCCGASMAGHFGSMFGTSAKWTCQ